MIICMFAASFIIHWPYQFSILATHSTLKTSTYGVLISVLLYSIHCFVEQITIINTHKFKGGTVAYSTGFIWDSHASGSLRVLVFHTHVRAVTTYLISMTVPFSFLLTHSHTRMHAHTNPTHSNCAWHITAHTAIQEKVHQAVPSGHLCSQHVRRKVPLCRRSPNSTGTAWNFWKHSGNNWKATVAMLTQTPSTHGENT